MKQKYKRLNLILGSVVLIILGLYLVLDSFNQSIIFFMTPTELKQVNFDEKVIRIGGMVKEHSLKKSSDDLTVEFIITDTREDVKIIFNGLLPNLFREKQGVVAKGILKENEFIAQELLVKHDENYMPKEVTQGYMKFSE